MRKKSHREKFVRENGEGGRGDLQSLGHDTSLPARERERKKEKLVSYLLVS